MATTSVTLAYMNNHFLDEPKTELSITSDSEIPVIAGDEVFQQVTNPRVQFLKLTSFARSNRGIPGKTYPFCPLAPTLARTPYPDTEEDVPKYHHKRRVSPLQNIALPASSKKSTRR